MDTQSVNFTCRVQAHPRPTITWYHEIEEGQEKQITSGAETEKYLISETNSTQDGVYVVSSILTISNLRSEDSGRIRCEATISVQANDQSPPEEETAYLSVLGKVKVKHNHI